jgi:hypothetical protein
VTPSSDQTLTQFAKALEKFDRDPVAARRHLRDLLSAETVDRNSQLWLAKAALDSAASANSKTALIATFAHEGLLVPLLSDAGIYPMAQASSLAMAAAEQIPAFGAQILRYATSLEPANDAVTLRALLLLRPLKAENRPLMQLMMVLRSPNPRIRAQAALLLSESKRDADWVAGLLDEMDPRLKANLLEGLWGLETPAAIACFTRGAMDDHHRVSTTALVGLYRAGSPNAAAVLEQMASGTDTNFRAAAAWAMGCCGDARFMAVLNGMARDAHPMVRRCALKALVRIRKQSRPENTLTA